LEAQRIVTLRSVDSAGWPYAIVDPALVDSHLAAMEREKAGYKATVRRWLDDKTVGGDSNDTNYIFLRFVTDYLPAGLIGLLIGVIFLAAWGSIAATLNSLASCTIVDFHKRFSRRNLSDKQEYRLSQLYTLIWGVFCVAMAQLAYGLGNSLIEAVNVLGSLFYGVILGIFLVAFYRKKIGGQAVFISAVIVETGVIVLTVLSRKGIVPLGFLWFNVIGAIGVVLLSELLQPLMRRPQQ
jgi:Na+/proline symporter